MTTRPPHKPQRPTGYPSEAAVRHGFEIAVSRQPEAVYRTCRAKLHNLSHRSQAALLQVFKANTLAAAWMLRDIRQHRPQRLFMRYRKPGGTTYSTDGIADALDKRYRKLIRGRFDLNSCLFEGLCVTLSETLSSWLGQMAEAEQKGLLRRYEEAAACVVDFGKHAGRTLKTLGRKIAFGYAFLRPTREQIEEVLRNLDIVLNEYSDDEERATAKRYKMPFDPRRGDALGTMHPATLRRLRLLVQRDARRVDQYERLRKVAQTYLEFTPPGFPSIKADGISSGRHHELETEFLEALKEYGEWLGVTELEEGTIPLAENERTLFRRLENRAYAATRVPKYVRLHWKRAYAPTQHRDAGLVYEPKSGEYALLLYVLASESRYRRSLELHRNLYDVNNPEVQLRSSRTKTSAMLFDLEFGSDQRRILDAARQEAGTWKSQKNKSGGCIRTVSLHAHYTPERDSWWFETHIVVGTKVDYLYAPNHVLGVHFDPVDGVYVAVLTLSGETRAAFKLDEARIAHLLQNHSEQSSIKPEKRTAKEQRHRIANALRTIGERYWAQIGLEDISYLRKPISASQKATGNPTTSVNTMSMFLDYKLLLEHLPEAVLIKGLAPRRDCCVCGARKDKGRTQSDQYTCPSCGNEQDRHINAAREVARRTLWMMANKKPQKPKTSRA